MHHIYWNSLHALESSVDPDQTAPKGQFDQGLLCFIIQ